MSKRLNSASLKKLILETVEEIKAEEKKNSRANQAYPCDQCRVKENSALWIVRT